MLRVGSARGTGSAPGGKSAVATVEEIRSIKERVEEDLMARPGVVAVGIGRKRVAGQPTDELAIRVYVRHKHDDLSEAELIPTEFDGVPTDVVESGGFALHDGD